MWATRRSTPRPNDVPHRFSLRLSRYATACAVIASLAAAPSYAGIDIQLNGTREVLERNVREYLSLTRYASRDDLTDELVERLERRIPTEVRKALEPLGYYAATATYSSEHKGNQWTVRIDIDPGRAVRIEKSTVEVTGPGAQDPDLQAVIARGDLHPGARLDDGVYENVKSELLRLAVNNGYFDAHWTHNEVIVDPVARRATVQLVLESGERYRFGTIDVEQDVLKDSLARRILRMQSGDPYSLDAILESQYLLDDSQYFSTVELQPGDPDHTTHEVPVQIHAVRNKRNRYGISAGYGTDTGVRGKLTWNNRFLNDSGHRMQVEETGSSVLTETNVKYIIPVRDVARDTFEIDLDVKREELADLISRKVELSFGLTQVYTEWQRVLFLRLSREDTETQPGTETTAVPGRTFLIIPGVSFATVPQTLLDRTPRHYAIYAELTGSPQTLGSDATFLQLRVNGERVFDLVPHWRLRLRGQVGITWSSDFDSIPASNRFYAGGDNSVRGFGLNELSPVDPVTHLRVGGRYLAVASVEVERDIRTRWFGDALSGAVFTDGGNAFDHLSDPFEYSVGVGVRYRLANVASIGIDVAQALSEKGRSPHFHLRLTTLF